MKKSRICLFLALILSLSLALCSCSALVAAFEDEKTRGYTDYVIGAIIDEDLDSAYSIFSDISDKDTFAEAFYKMKDLTKDVDSYELKLLSINTSSSILNGQSTTETHSVYEMSTNADKYIVEVKTASYAPKLSSFYIVPFESTDYYYTGTLTSMKDAGAVQWVLLLGNLLFIGLMIFALIDCCRHKVKLKALWIIIIILGISAFSITFGPTQLNFNINFGWLTAYNALIRYGSGTNTLRVMLPLGSIVYFALRFLIIKREKPAEEPVFIPVDPANETESAPELAEENGEE